jgi:hypothetical protein
MNGIRNINNILLYLGPGSIHGEPMYTSRPPSVHSRPGSVHYPSTPQTGYEPPPGSYHHEGSIYAENPYQPRPVPVPASSYHSTRSRRSSRGYHTVMPDMIGSGAQLSRSYSSGRSGRHPRDGGGTVLMVDDHADIEVRLCRLTGCLSADF